MSGSRYLFSVVMAVLCRGMVPVLSCCTASFTMLSFMYMVLYDSPANSLRPREMAYIDGIAISVKLRLSVLK